MDMDELEIVDEREGWKAKTCKFTTRVKKAKKETEDSVSNSDDYGSEMKEAVLELEPKKGMPMARHKSQQPVLGKRFSNVV